MGKNQTAASSRKGSSKAPTPPPVASSVKESHDSVEAESQRMTPPEAASVGEQEAALLTELRALRARTDEREAIARDLECSPEQRATIEAGVAADRAAIESVEQRLHKVTSRSLDPSVVWWPEAPAGSLAAGKPSATTEAGEPDEGDDDAPPESQVPLPLPIELRWFAHGISVLWFKGIDPQDSPNRRRSAAGRVLEALIAQWVTLRPIVSPELAALVDASLKATKGLLGRQQVPDDKRLRSTVDDLVDVAEQLEFELEHQAVRIEPEADGAPVPGVEEKPSDVTATGPAKGGVGSDQKGPKVLINARMYDAMLKDKERFSWTLDQWAIHLGCSRTGVHGTPAWKTLMTMRADAKRETTQRHGDRTKGM